MPLVLCAWCGKTLRDGPDIVLDSHGMCAGCAAASGVFPIEELLSMSAEDFDRLPFGVMEIDSDGRLRAYNRAEEELSGVNHSHFLGKNFFREVAPCTQVREFEGRFRDLVAGGVTQDTEFAFVFRFRSGERLVMIQLIFDAAGDRGLICVRALQ